MLKDAGLILMVLAGAGLGFSGSCRLTQRLEALNMCMQMAVYLKGEIRYGRLSLKEAFADGADKLSGEYRGFFQAVSRELEQNTEKTFAQIFTECGEQYLGKLELTREEQEEFLVLGSRLGHLDVEMQCRQLELYESNLIQHIQEVRAQIPAKKKVYQSLGLLGGLLAAVLVW